MAIDALQIDGIKGESADSAHQGWIELTSNTFTAHQAMNPIAVPA
jgi:type VI secretion system secreted protein Hcp